MSEEYSLPKSKTVQGGLMIGTSLPEQYFRGRAESRSTLPLPLLLLPLLLPELLLLLLSSSLIAAQELAAAEQVRIKPKRLQCDGCRGQRSMKSIVKTRASRS